MEATITKKTRSLDFGKFKLRHIALKIAYFGWDYDGLAYQNSSENTVENHLINALIKTCLIESREKCRLNRCGRTDKGVSSFSQVVDLYVKSNQIDESQTLGLITPEGYTGPQEVTDQTRSTSNELRYVDMLNGVLPELIRILAWAPVKREFSSRFDCKSRSYSYVFPKGDLCIESMKKAAGYLVGTHDFRNLCSLDLKGGVFHHVRTIYSTSIQAISAEASLDNQYSFYQFVIVGKGFLYHQIRCIMTILFLVARKKEEPEVVRNLLDIGLCPAKPVYCPASPLPLSLFGCQYESDQIQEWLWDTKTLFDVYKKLKRLWLVHKTKTIMIEQVLSDTETLLEFKSTEADLGLVSKSSWKDFGLEHDNMSDLKYVPIMKRNREECLERKIEILERKTKRLKPEDHDATGDE